MVTIKPIHSLVVGIMEGVGEPTLLMKGDKSPHTQSLTPEEVSGLKNADLVIWIGPTYESLLCRVIGPLKGKVLTLMNAPGMRLYPSRQGGLWGQEGCCCHDHGGDSDEEEQEDDSENQAHDALSTDGHIWLDPYNAKAIVKVVVEKLAALDPQHKAAYLANSQKVINRLAELESEIEAHVAKVKDKAYLVYHDGTQYFDRRFSTKAVGALMGPHHTITAQHLLEVRNYIQGNKVYCIFTEPQFPTMKIQALVDQTGTNIQNLDYLGIDLAADGDAYFLMMRQLVNGFLKGLE
jgi:zinc transport system substrate-binding protein